MSPVISAHNSYTDTAVQRIDLEHFDKTASCFLSGRPLPYTVSVLQELQYLHSVSAIKSAQICKMVRNIGDFHASNRKNWSGSITSHTSYLDIFTYPKGHSFYAICPLKASKLLQKTSFFRICKKRLVEKPLHLEAENDEENGYFSPEEEEGIVPRDPLLAGFVKAVVPPPGGKCDKTSPFSHKNDVFGRTLGIS
jgi:hypothetical protein